MCWRSLAADETFVQCRAHNTHHCVFLILANTPNSQPPPPQDISPSKLRYLHELPVLEELTLGCHHRLIASTVTDACLAELVGLVNLKHLNLSQCVHVRDAGGATWLVGCCTGVARAFVCAGLCDGVCLTHSHTPWSHGSAWLAGEEHVPSRVCSSRIFFMCELGP